MKGRKPLPRGTKALRGNPGKRPIGEDPSVLPGLPECPEHLDDEARREWFRVATELHGAGLLAGLDRAALSAYCAAWSRWIFAEVELRRDGLMVTTPNGYKVQSPFLAVANKAMEQMRALLSEFGMSPSSRSRVTSTGQPTAQNPFEALDEERIFGPHKNPKGKRRFFA